MSDAKTTEIPIYNDFDIIKSRISKQVEGHRSDIVVAALRAVIDDVTWFSNEQRTRDLHKDLMKEIENVQA